LYEDLIDFKRRYWPGTNVVKDEKGGLVKHSHSILARRKSHFSQLLNVVHGVYYVGQTELHTADPLVPESSGFETEMAIEKLKRQITIY